MLVQFRDFIDRDDTFPARLIESDGMLAVIRKADGTEMPVLCEELRPLKRIRERILFRLAEIARLR